MSATGVIDVLPRTVYFLEYRENRSRKWLGEVWATREQAEAHGASVMRFLPEVTAYRVHAVELPRDSVTPWLEREASPASRADKGTGARRVRR